MERKRGRLAALLVAAATLPGAAAGGEGGFVPCADPAYLAEDGAAHGAVWSPGRARSQALRSSKRSGSARVRAARACRPIPAAQAGQSPL
ncbi:hypothetical protein [Mangrovicoccus ximenensis]|uniref:hypothetical protein n=1 Tax=Mangrovicoccus ximenensis TaxID=1911570 RepID=UPI001374DB38|nr:hypothetical protein [Mangrovicoccus ximenensis]